MKIKFACHSLFSAGSWCRGLGKAMTLFLMMSHSAFAENNPLVLAEKQDAVSLMTPYDLLQRGSSNLNLTNHTGSPLTVYGVYLSGVAFITPGLSCAVGVQNEGQNVLNGSGAQGSIVVPVSFATGQSIPIGQNYLYNMLYNFLYWELKDATGLVCALPGCSWPGDRGPYNWCLKVGGLSAQAPNNFAASGGANTPPYAYPQNDPYGPYAYDLIPNPVNYVWIGPFTCNDQSLTCSTETTQYQPFPS